MLVMPLQAQGMGEVPRVAGKMTPDSLFMSCV